jgi:hypothetical protein
LDSMGIVGRKRGKVGWGKSGESERKGGGEVWGKWREIGVKTQLKCS